MLISYLRNRPLKYMKRENGFEAWQRQACGVSLPLHYLGWPLAGVCKGWKQVVLLSAQALAHSRFVPIQAHEPHVALRHFWTDDALQFRAATTMIRACLRMAVQNLAGRWRPADLERPLA